MTTNANQPTQLELLEHKLMDAEIPGHYALFTDEEAAIVGAFHDDALSEESALRGSYDNPDLFSE